MFGRRARRGPRRMLRESERRQKRWPCLYPIGRVANDVTSAFSKSLFLCCSSAGLPQESRLSLRHPPGGWGTFLSKYLRCPKGHAQQPMNQLSNIKLWLECVFYGWRRMRMVTQTLRQEQSVVFIRCLQKKIKWKKNEKDEMDFEKNLAQYKTIAL